MPPGNQVLKMDVQEQQQLWPGSFVLYQWNDLVKDLNGFDKYKS